MKLHKIHQIIAECNFIAPMCYKKHLTLQFRWKCFHNKTIHCPPSAHNFNESLNPVNCNSYITFCGVKVYMCTHAYRCEWWVCEGNWSIVARASLRSVGLMRRTATWSVDKAMQIMKMKRLREVNGALTSTFVLVDINTYEHNYYTPVT